MTEQLNIDTNNNVANLIREVFPKTGYEQQLLYKIAKNYTEDHICSLMKENMLYSSDYYKYIVDGSKELRFVFKVIKMIEKYNQYDTLEHILSNIGIDIDEYNNILAARNEICSSIGIIYEKKEIINNFLKNRNDF